ncbi:MAG: type II toxin-antitoxin system Phd/YefM family antitoxin [Clostridiales Family XIII bacterium]|jgi:antitoxin YefM|nr:type II toxin-antitoxin system Phd/YefM family antitoxin [Clostridiales Family XIII bacterium]
MIEMVNYTEFRKNITRSFDFVNEEDSPLIITRGKKKPVVMISLEEYNSWKETEYLTSSEANKKALDESIESIRNGKNLTEVKLIDGIFQEVK